MFLHKIDKQSRKQRGIDCFEKLVFIEQNKMFLNPTNVSDISNCNRRFPSTKMFQDQCIAKK